MTMTEQADPRIWTKPKGDCPDWCEEHSSSTDETGEFAFDAHRSVIERHYWPAQIPTWPNGVRTLTVEQIKATPGRLHGAQAVLTFWPGKDCETRQDFDERQLREFIRDAQRALKLLEEITE